MKSLDGKRETEQRAIEALERWNEWAIRTGYKRPEEVNTDVARFTYYADAKESK